MGNCIYKKSPHSSIRIIPSSVHVFPPTPPPSIKIPQINSTILEFDFYIPEIKNKNITIEDYFNVKETWSKILNNDLYMFYLLKTEGKITATDSITWVYDTFFKNVYKYNPELKNVFHTNIKLQAKAFVNIIKYFIDISYKISHKIKVNYITFYNLHEKYSIKFYFEISHVLLDTFKGCLCNIFTNEIEMSWRKIMSIFIKNIIILDTHPPRSRAPQNIDDK